MTVRWIIGRVKVVNMTTRFNVEKPCKNSARHWTVPLYFYRVRAVQRILLRGVGWVPRCGWSGRWLHPSRPKAHLGSENGRHHSKKRRSGRHSTFVTRTESDCTGFVMTHMQIECVYVRDGPSVLVSSPAKTAFDTIDAPKPAVTGT